MSTPTSTRTGQETTPAPAAEPTADAPAADGEGVPAAEVIAGARERIDALDERILALIGERMEVSARIQRARIASGGRRLNLAREMEILDRYRRRLGAPGTRLAMLLLELCRGRA